MTWAETHGHRPLMHRRNVKALLLSHIVNQSERLSGGLDETADGFRVVGNRGAIDFEFDAAPGYALAARIANERPEHAAEIGHGIHLDAMEDARDPWDRERVEAAGWDAEMDEAA